MVLKEGIKQDPAKMEMRNYLAPTNISEVRQFLDLASYYIRTSDSLATSFAIFEEECHTRVDARVLRCV